MYQTGGYQPPSPSTGVASGAFAHAETFELVEGQRDYIFTDFTGANTDAVTALVQVTSMFLIPNTQYAILTDRIRLSVADTPSAEQAGIQMHVRVSAS